MAEKKDQTRIDVAKKIRGLINRQIPNEENAKRKAAAFMKNLEDSMPTMENAQRKADAFLKKIGAGKYSRSAQTRNVKGTAKDAATASAKRKVMDRVNTEQGKTDRAKARAEAAKRNQEQIKAKTTSKPKPKTASSNTSKEPTSIAQAKRMGKSYFIGKDGKKKAAVTAEDLKKSGHKNLQAYLNAKGKPAKKAKK